MSKSSQSKWNSFLESIANNFIGIIISLLGQFLIFPLEGLRVSLGANIRILLFFTILSIVRSYFVRRFFNWLHVKEKDATVL